MRTLIIVLVVAGIVALVLAVAVGPLLAMRNPAEADKPVPGNQEADQEPTAGQDAAKPPTPRTGEDGGRTPA